MADEWNTVVNVRRAQARGGKFDVLAVDPEDSVSVDGPSALRTTGSDASSSMHPWTPGGTRVVSAYSQGSPGNRSPGTPSTVSSRSSGLTQGSELPGFTPVKPGRPRGSRPPGVPTGTARGLSSALSAAAQTCQDRLARGNRALQKEYEKVQAKAGANRSYDAAYSEVNRGKNRYEDVPAFNYNRVLLHHEDPGNWKYINASLVASDEPESPGWHYIVTQGPLFCTINDFWQMVFEQKSSIILMLTDFEEVTEHGEKISKSERYLPDPGDDIVPYGSQLVQLLSEEPLENFPAIIKRQLSVTNLDHNDEHLVTHYQYTHWPDKRVPLDSRSVLELVRILEESGTAYKESPKPGPGSLSFSSSFGGSARPGPPIVHCNSGIGRSATFCAIDVALRRLRYVNPTSAQDAQAAVSFKDLVIFLRRQRISMVETLDQYRFCYQAVYDAITRGHV